MEKLYKFTGNMIAPYAGGDSDAEEFYVLAENPRQALDRFFSASPGTTLFEPGVYRERQKLEFKLETVKDDEIPEDLLEKMAANHAKKAGFVDSKFIC